jgi:hypothetical protein
MLRWLRRRRQGRRLAQADAEALIRDRGTEAYGEARQRGSAERKSRPFERAASCYVAARSAAVRRAAMRCGARPLVAVAMAIGANPAMAVGTGSDDDAWDGRDDDAGVHGMTMPVGSASKSRTAAHRDRRDACRRVGERRDRHRLGGNGGQPQQCDR